MTQKPATRYSLFRVVLLVRKLCCRRVCIERGTHSVYSNTARVVGGDERAVDTTSIEPARRSFVGIDFQLQPSPNYRKYNWFTNLLPNPSSSQ